MRHFSRNTPTIHPISIMIGQLGSNGLKTPKISMFRKKNHFSKNPIPDSKFNDASDSDN